jgi:hypothetical protein
MRAPPLAISIKATRDLDALGLGGADEILFLALGKQQIVGERGGALVIGQGARSQFESEKRRSNLGLAPGV